ncbi:prolyl aminopeptidase [uncultured Erythrobacter sp.]|uniref:prolyl aminopeptidase n=1 Tax=uncultured Erythrobacter sp. TaxID=263913 RepID=UPI002657EB9F|nr:prolyl aminopeptidase [uncultured Erythrobacter sp.]
MANPRASGHLDCGDGHQVWWELTGNPAGVPVVVVHGGPGGSIRPYYRRLIDPDHQQGVFFDQRGCGKSLPAGALDHNTTPDLVADMERLRTHLGFERWTVLGGSWGSTLALAYAEAHPERVAGLVVSGVYLARAFDVWWWWQGGGHVFPEVFAARDAWLPEDERSDPRSAFIRRILDLDPAIHRTAAHILGMAESQTLDLWPATPGDDLSEITDAAVQSARIFAHFEAHDYFLAPDQLLRDAGRLAGVPGAIVAGRSDMCTPPQSAWDLAQAWPDARLHIVPAAGHRWNDEQLCRPIIAELARLTEAG